MDATKPAKAPKSAKVAKVAKAGKCACCGKNTRGGNYLPGHDARHASTLVAAVAKGKRTAETALAEIPASQTKLVAKVAARLNALPQK